MNNSHYKWQTKLPCRTNPIEHSQLFSISATWSTSTPTTCWPATTWPSSPWRRPTPFSLSRHTRTSTTRVQCPSSSWASTRKPRSWCWCRWSPCTGWPGRWGRMARRQWRWCSSGIVQGRWNVRGILMSQSNVISPKAFFSHNIFYYLRHNNDL